MAEDLRVFRHVGFFVSRKRMFRELRGGTLINHGMEKFTMRRMLSVFCKVSPGTRAITSNITLWKSACLVALGGALTLTQSLAKEPDATETKQASQSKTDSIPDRAEVVAIPACLEALNLTQPQQARAKEIIGKYDASLDAVWKQFGKKYLETVRAEVELLATIEDKLTEPQRTQVRGQRRLAAHAEKALEGTTSKPNQATAEPADAAEQATAGAGISLTDEQEAAADKIQLKYVGYLRSLNRDIQGLHTRLISLEADKLVELEKLLSKDQLSQLREGREAMRNAPKVIAGERTSTIIE